MNKGMSNRFRPRARLLIQLGDQLIRNENIAVIELVKNAYDADARKCKVLLNNIDNIQKGEIIISDNGIGMTPEIVKEVWLEPGANNKELILKGDELPENFAYTAKRMPIGEKGIGRFGAHKLGNYIEMITKSARSNKEVVVRIDWDTFSEVRYLEDANLFIEERKPEIFIGKKTGTRIKINKIKKNWNSDCYKELHRSLISLSSPFRKKTDFSVALDLKLGDEDKEVFWNEDLLTVDDIKDRALWTFNCTMCGREITEFSYKFNPWKTMEKLNSRTITKESPEYHKSIQILKKRKANIDLGLYKVGEIKIEAYSFDLSPKILKLGFQDKKGLNEFLSINGGVKVYRDDMRIYNYGEPGDDWLDLDKSRINQPASKIGNKNIVAAVQLRRVDSVDLREKTNREGFIEDGAYEVFHDAVHRAIDVFAQLRNIDKQKIREIYGGSSKTEPVIYDIDELKESLYDKLQTLKGDDKKFISKKENIEKELINGLNQIKQQYITTNELLLKSAGAGLSLGVVIHEIDKRIKELSKMVEEPGTDFDLERARNLVKSVKKLVENYTVLISNEKKVRMGLEKIINDAIFNSEFRFKAHNIEVIRNFEKKDPIKIHCSLNTIIGVLINIFDNSIFWLNYNDIKNKKIYIDTKEYKDGEVGIIIADNGRGFALSTEDAIKPFISLKPGGMGLGLHIVSEMIKAYDGRFVIREYKETKNVPKEFINGAIVELIFHKENGNR